MLKLMVDVQAPIESIIVLSRFMRDRQYIFTKHCNEKIEQAKSTGDEQIRQINENEFLSEVSKKNSQDYKVMIRDDKEFTACVCET